MLLALLALLTTCPSLAQDNAPGGYRLTPELPSTSASIRPALVTDPEWAPVFQATVDARWWLDPWAVHVEHPWVFAWQPDGDWSRTAPGLLRLGATRAVSKKPRWLGLELALPLTPPGMTATSWASLAQESVFGVGGMVSYERLWAHRSPTSLRVALGVRYWGDCVHRWCGMLTPSLFPAAEIIAARSWQLAPGWALVTEAELVIDAIPASIRLLGRRVQPLADGCLVLDLGVQVPPWTYAEYFSFQAVGQLRWYPQGITLVRPPPPDEPPGTPP